MAMNKRFGRLGWTPTFMDSLEGKTYLVTGATTGTGYEATRLFLSKGAKVVMLNRSGTRSAAVITKLKDEFGQKAEVSFIHMDLSVLDSVRKAVLEIWETVAQIDALICNAAISQVARQEITIDGFESHLGVNHYGHFLLCGLLFNRIEASGGRIVIVGSLSYKMGLKRIKFEDLDFYENYNAWNPYAHSKLALMMFGYELQRRIKEEKRKVGVYICHPGASRTDLLKGDNLNPVTKTVWALIAPFVAQSAKRGSWPIVMCATEKGLEAGVLYGPTKRRHMVGAIDASEPEKHALDRKEAVQLWKLSEKKTSLTWSP